MLEFNNYYGALIAPFVCTLLYLVYLRLQKPLEYRQISSHVPSITKTLWSEILVSWKLAILRPNEHLPYYTKIIRENGPVVHFNLAGRSYVFLTDPDDLKILLSNSDYIKKGNEYDMLRPWLKEGLLTSTGSKWHNRRRLLTNTFHFKTLSMYNPSTNNHSQILVNKLLEASAKEGGINIIEYIKLCSLDIICETIMGTKMNAQYGKSVEYVKAIDNAAKSVIDRIYKFWLWDDIIYRISSSGQTFFKSVKVLHDFTDNIIQSKRMLLKNPNNQTDDSNTINYETSKSKSFLDLLFNVLEENPDQMTDKDIQEEVDTFLFEGHDTSSVSMSMTIILLGIHQDIQEKARKELLGIFGDSDRNASIEDLNNMKYLEAVIKESLRLFPSVPGFTRELQKTLNIKNYSIPPMTTITVLPYVIHRNEKLFPNPEKFIPERFLDEDFKSKIGFGYIPFSAGYRNCIGQKYAMYQMKTVISSILRKSIIETLGTVEDIKISMQLLIRIDSIPKVKFHAI